CRRCCSGTGRGGEQGVMMPESSGSQAPPGNPLPRGSASSIDAAEAVEAEPRGSAVPGRAWDRGCDAFLLVSFGGPEGRDEVLPFLENVLRGKNVPRERMLEVAEHYYHFDGVSPINAQCRDLLSALRAEFSGHGLDLPIYWGNRNWDPMLTDILRKMRDDGVKRAVALVTSAFGSYSGCRQYREDIERAGAAVEGAPAIEKLPPFWDHPAFVETMTARVQEALGKLPGADVVYTAHSI